MTLEQTDDITDIYPDSGILTAFKGSAKTAVALGIRSNYSASVDVDMNVALTAHKHSTNMLLAKFIYYPLENYPEIQSKQVKRRNEKNFIESPAIHGRFLLPHTYLMWVKQSNYTKKINNYINRIYAKTKSAEIRWFYSDFRRTLGNNKLKPQDYPNWLQTIDHHIVPFVSDMLEYQITENSCLLIPPTPPIKELGLGMEFAWKFYKAALDLTTSYTNSPPVCLFLPLSVQCFNSLSEVDAAAKKLSEQLLVYRPNAILFHFYNESSSLDQINKNIGNIKYFYKIVSDYCVENDKTSIIVDSFKIGTELARLKVNILGCPVDGKSDICQHGGPSSSKPDFRKWKIRPHQFGIPKEVWLHQKEAINYGKTSLPGLKDYQSVINYSKIPNIKRREVTQINKLYNIQSMLDLVEKINNEEEDDENEVPVEL